jgi:hypothetical protein
MPQKRHQSTPLIVCLTIFNFVSANASSVPNEWFKVSYQYAKTEGSATRIFPVSTYLEALRKDRVIHSATWRPCCEGFFKWSFPELSVKTANSTSRVGYLSEMIFTVSKSELNEEPVIIVEEEFSGRLIIHNEGWGQVISPSFDFTMEVNHTRGRQARPTKISKLVLLQTFDERAVLNFTEYMQLDERKKLGQLSGKVLGTLSYKNKKGQVRALMLESSIYFGPPPAPYVPPSPVAYDVLLPAGVAPYIARIPISQVVDAGGVDHFLVRVASDRSAHFDFKVELKTVEGQIIPGGQFILDMFVPRSAAGAAVARRARASSFHLFPRGVSPNGRTHR